MCLLAILLGGLPAMLMFFAFLGFTCRYEGQYMNGDKTGLGKLTWSDGFSTWLS